MLDRDEQHRNLVAAITESAEVAHAILRGQKMARAARSRQKMAAELDAVPGNPAREIRDPRACVYCGNRRGVRKEDGIGRLCKDSDACVQRNQARSEPAPFREIARKIRSQARDAEIALTGLRDRLAEEIALTAASRAKKDAAELALAREDAPPGEYGGALFVPRIDHPMLSDPRHRRHLYGSSSTVSAPRAGDPENRAALGYGRAHRGGHSESDLVTGAPASDREPVPDAASDTAPAAGDVPGAGHVRPKLATAPYQRTRRERLKWTRRFPNAY